MTGRVLKKKVKLDLKAPLHRKGSRIDTHTSTVGLARPDSVAVVVFAAGGGVACKIIPQQE